jgi:hypothetical protein
MHLSGRVRAERQVFFYLATFRARGEIGTGRVMSALTIIWVDL